LWDDIGSIYGLAFLNGGRKAGGQRDLYIFTDGRGVQVIRMVYDITYVLAKSRQDEEEEDSDEDEEGEGDDFDDDFEDEEEE